MSGSTCVRDTNLTRADWRSEIFYIAFCLLHASGQFRCDSTFGICFCSSCYSR